MDVDTLLASAQALRSTFVELAEHAAGRQPDLRLRAEVGVLGRTGEARMLAATRGVNTHRGALWALGLLACGAANSADIDDICQFGAALARRPDLNYPLRQSSHGALAERRYHVSGARGQAQGGFSYVRQAVSTLRRERQTGSSPTLARLTALLELIARLDDTCVLHRGGTEGLAQMQRGAQAVLDAGGPGASEGHRLLTRLDELARNMRLSPGGSGDLLAAAMFLDELTRPASGAAAIAEVREAQ